MRQTHLLDPSQPRSPRQTHLLERPQPTSPELEACSRASALEAASLGDFLQGEVRLHLLAIEKKLDELAPVVASVLKGADSGLPAEHTQATTHTPLQATTPTPWKHCAGRVETLESAGNLYSTRSKLEAASFLRQTAVHLQRGCFSKGRGCEICHDAYTRIEVLRPTFCSRQGACVVEAKAPRKALRCHRGQSIIEFFWHAQCDGQGGWR
mmetsp:Transcript_102725/g.199108  ORF Transcript_102725/g.199108 Transcript_102725/m.199108 type:complete len:210 (+) Transcript_102725:51-680(+)